MPFHRGVRLTDPNDGITPGFWIQLSTDPVRTWTGLARVNWPAIVSTGPVAGRDTATTYGSKVTNALRILCTKILSGRSTKVVVPTITFSSLSPLTIAEVIVDEGDCQGSLVVRAV